MIILSKKYNLKMRVGPKQKTQQMINDQEPN